MPTRITPNKDTFYAVNTQARTSCGIIPPKKENTVKKLKFSIKDFFSKCDLIHRKLRIWSHLRKKSLMENFSCCAVEAEI